MAPRPPLQEDRREGQDEGGEAGWQAWHGGVSRRGRASLAVPPAAPPSSPRRPLSRPPNPPPNGQSRAQRRISEFPGEASCNQEETGGLEQGLDGEPEAVPPVPR